MLTTSHRGRRNRSGFTLIELVTVVTIVIILAGVVVPRVSGFADKSKYAKAASDLKAIKRSLEYMYQDLGYFPADVGPDVDPGLNDINRVPTSIRGDWNGPYLEAWPHENPWGATYDYEYWNYSAFNFDGTGGNEVLVSVRGGIDATIAAAIDDIIDDGVTTTGLCRYASGTLSMYVGEGRRW